MKAKAGEARQFYEASLLIQTDDCILWPFSVGGTGYAQLSKGVLVMHLVCEQEHGPRPKGLQVAHNCGVRRCINRRHLRWTTQSGNEADKRKHGTYQGKLKPRQVLSIRALHGFVQQKSLAEHFKVSLGTIEQILSRKTWRHL